MSRVLIVSNRLPVSLQHAPDGSIPMQPSPGGLGTGLLGPHARGEGIWIGWPGNVARLSKPRRNALREALAELRLRPVELSPREVRAFYQEVANGVLWPVCHNLVERVPVNGVDWTTYAAVNQRFCDAVVAEYRQGDLIWVHDYHLMLLPAMLRARLPEARIGFFLHIPFPPEEAFSVLPRGAELLQGLLGADLVGFHTTAYLRHFGAALRRALGLEPEADRVRWGSRSVGLGVFPMGVDFESWAASASEPGTAAAVAAIRSEAAGRRILLGVDRLDYTKGIPRRLLAIERLLEEDPSLREGVRVIQVTVPSREDVREYSALKRQVDELVGRINGRFATALHVPIHRMHRSLGRSELLALYAAADVLVATPLRDGMNLVCKEFAASRVDEDGVLVLSEFAGAAEELGGALLVNPYDIEGTAAAIRAALAMPAAERRARMRALRARVAANDVQRWADGFLERLTARAVRPGRSGALSISSASELAALAARLRRAAALAVVLDYDGTLVPFASAPDDAAPDQALLQLLGALAARPRTHVHIVSGRSRASLDRWLSGLPLTLWAEHGAWCRPKPGAPWRQLYADDGAWKLQARGLLARFSESVTGSFVEEKTAALAWHYRAAAERPGAAEFVERRARELRALLSDVLADAGVDVAVGERRVEVRSLALRKSALLPLILAQAEGMATVLAIGDEEIDESIFRALSGDSASVRVGFGPSQADYRVSNVRAARALLHALLVEQPEARGPVAAVRR